MATKRSRSPPKLVSHYTTVEGLVGIIDSGCLWASNVSFLNDRKELVHGLEAARKVITRLSSVSALSAWSKYLDDVVTEMEGGAIPETYAACFCQSSDKLSQWRAYGSNQGVALTFNTQKIRQLFKADKAALYPVIYGRITTKQKVLDALRAELQDLAELEDVFGDSTPAERRQDVFRRVSRLLPQFKHLGFQDEKEWRFVVQRDLEKDDVCFRSGNGIIVPYIKLGGQRDARLPLESVRVGPGPDQGLTQHSIKQFLVARGYRDVEIGVSDVPYRQ